MVACSDHFGCGISTSGLATTTCSGNMARAEPTVPSPTLKLWTGKVTLGLEVDNLEGGLGIPISHLIRGVDRGEGVVVAIATALS